MKYRIIFFFCSLLCVVTTIQSQVLNLDMEEVEAYGRPYQWLLGHPMDMPVVYSFRADSSVKHGGHYSLQMRSTSERSKFATCIMQIPATFTGQTLILKGFIKTEKVDNGFASFFMTVLKDDTTVLQYDNMYYTSIKGTHDWREVELTLTNFPEATKINFGGLLVGKGTAWFDDLTLSIDDKRIVSAPVLHPDVKNLITNKLVKF